MFSRMRAALNVWARGRYILPPPNRPFDSVILISPGLYERPWPVRAWRYIRKHGLQALTAAAALAGLAVSLREFFK